MDGRQSTDPPTPLFGAFLRRRGKELVDRWARGVRELPHARTLDRPRLINHVPELLVRIAAVVEGERGSVETLERESEEHAIQRLDVGYELGEVVAEYAELRRTVAAAWAVEQGHVGWQDLARLHGGIDDAVVVAVTRFARTRQRTLEGLERVSALALEEGEDVDGFLQKLLGVLRSTTEAVDTAAVFLREHDRLRPHAAVGSVGEEAHASPAEEQFAEQVAAERRPRMLETTDGPVRTLYGVPLVHRDELVGVAQIGSRSAVGFSVDDRVLFQTMANRATMLIVQLRMNATLRAREEQQRLAAEATDLGTWDWDLASDGLHWSARCKAIFGLPAATAMSPPMFLAAIHPEDRAQVAQQLQGVVGDEGARVQLDTEFRILRPDGTTRWVAARGRVLRDVVKGATRPARFIGTMLDVTRRRTAEGERERLLEELDESIRHRDAMAAALSHDLAAPLGTIIMTASVLLKALDSKEQARLQLIVRSAQRADRMINDLLRVTALESGKTGLRLEPHDAQELVAEAIAAAPSETIALRSDVVGDPGLVLCDRDELLRVLGNLIGNALKFSPGGTTVTVRVEAMREFVRFAVIDQGPGVPTESQPRIFERGYQAPHERGGLGLGLAIAKGIVTSHGGEIGLAQRASGAEFWFTIPRAPPSS